MKSNFVDCFMLMGTALSMSKNGLKLPEMGRPLLQDIFTTSINISLTVQEFKFIDVQNMIVQMDAIISQKWVDPRLGANIKTRKLAVAGQIWKPKITNINADVVCSNNHENTIFWRGFGDEGNVLLSEKVSLQAKCTGNFWNFPFDTQICEFKFGSYRFPAEEVDLQWDFSTPVEIINTKSDNNNFILVNVTTYNEIDIRTSGNFSVAVVQFTLKRQFSHYLICISFPCILLTLLNYITFYFNLNQRTLRLKINLIIFGILLYIYFLSVCSTQSVPYLKAIDIFVVICMTFSLTTLLESFTIDSLCNIEEIEFHLKKIACRKEYPRIVYWMELAMKISYPVFYLFSLIVFSFFYM